MYMLRQSPFRWQKIQVNHVYSAKELIGKITEKSKDRHNLTQRRKHCYSVHGNNALLSTKKVYSFLG